jgi:hypothetical protein
MQDGLAAKQGADFIPTGSRAGVVARYRRACILISRNDRLRLILDLFDLSGCHETGHRDRDVENA